jgi:DinB superfamily
MTGAPLHPQLEAVRAELVSAQHRLQHLVYSIPESAWNRRPDPTRWSVSECVAHLNLTAEAYLPLLHSALESARRAGGRGPSRYRRDPVGWLLWRTAGPPVRYRTRTTARFIPSASLSVEEVLSEFDRLQAAQINCVLQADGLDLGRYWITSPFNPRVRYNVYSCLTILPRHQHRHLWQAEATWKRMETSVQEDAGCGAISDKSKSPESPRTHLIHNVLTPDIILGCPEAQLFAPALGLQAPPT